MASSLRSLSQIWNKNSRLDGEEVINNVPAVNGSGSRRQLSRQFKSVSDATKKEEQPKDKRLLRSRGVLSSISSLNVTNVPKETRKLLQAGADKVNQTLSDVRSTLGTWSQVWSIEHFHIINNITSVMNFLFQKLKNPNRRRERLINSSPYTPGRGKGTPRTKQLLGRTPTKLYRFTFNQIIIRLSLIEWPYFSFDSPFGIETPSDRRQRNHQNFYGKPGTYTPTRAGSNKRSGSSIVSGTAFNAVSVYSPTQVCTHQLPTKTIDHHLLLHFSWAGFPKRCPTRPPRGRRFQPSS